MSVLEILKIKLRNIKEFFLISQIHKSLALSSHLKSLGHNTLFIESATLNGMFIQINLTLYVHRIRINNNT